MIPIQLKNMRFNRVRFKEKRAFESGWQKKPYSYDKIQNYFPKENYGVMCGKELRVLDDDTPNKGLIKLFLDNFGETFRVRDHLYFKFDNGHDKKIIFKNNKVKFDDGRGGFTSHMGECQGEGTYVVGVGSTHPTGAIYDLRNDKEIITISYDKFKEIFGEYFIENKVIQQPEMKYNSDDDNFIKAIKEQWTKGNRQDLAMSIAGYLRKEKRLGLNSVLGVVSKICIDCDDFEINSRLAAVRSTYDKDEKEVKGITGLKEKNIKTNEILNNEILNLILGRKEDEATELVVKQILNTNYIDSIKQDKTREIWFYEDGIRKPNGESHIKQICRNVMGSAYTPQRANKVVAKIQADSGIEADDFFKQEMNNINEIAVLNGVLNIKTRELSNFTPDKIFFNKVNCEYNPGATCPATELFLKSTLKNPEDIEVSFEISGSCLYKKYMIQKAIMFIGDGENGKGVYINHLKKFLGEKSCSSVPLNQLTSDSFSVAGLFGKNANLAGDISNTGLKDTGCFKELSSGTDTTCAHRKFLNDLFFENYAKLLFSCNELPRVYDFTHGFWRRWLILEFPYKFLKQNEYNLCEDKTNVKIADSEIIDKISSMKELSGFLNKSLDGLDRLFKNKEFSATKSTSAIKDFWIRKSDSFTAFAFDELEEDPECHISKRELRKAFHNYCKKYKVKGTSEKNIKVVLEDNFGVIANRHYNGSDQVWEWEGVKFKEKNNISSISKGFLPLGQISNMPLGVKTPTLLTNFKKKPKKTLKKPKKILIETFLQLGSNNDLIKKEDLEVLEIENLDFELNKLKSDGLICEPKENFYQLL